MKMKQPLAYFKAVKWFAQVGGKSFIAARFSQQVQGTVVPSITEYIRQLYFTADATPKPRALAPTVKFVKEEEVSAALGTLGNKASGIDRLKDT